MRFIPLSSVGFVGTFLVLVGLLGLARGRIGLGSHGGGPRWEGGPAYVASTICLLLGILVFCWLWCEWKKRKAEEFIGLESR